jgi:MFS family permease
MVATDSPVAQPTVAPGAWLRAGLALVSVGWGANQFAPLIVLYQTRLGLSSAVVDAMFALYALGLIPALLVGGRVSDRLGRRRVVLPSLVVSMLATCLLMLGGARPGWLYVGRLLAGIASGLAFGTGAAWLKELSSGTGDAAAGPRRATIAMTIGFAAGPFVAGVLAQWLPAPTVIPYVPHLVLLVVAIIAVSRVPDPLGAAASTEPDSAASSRAPELGRHFLLVLLPFAPWVFGTAAVGLAYLPALVAERVGPHALLFSAAATTLTAVTGVLAQPLAKALHRPNEPRLLLGSMASVMLGIGCAAWAAYSVSPTAVLVACAVLGVAYGTSQFCGLVEVQRVADRRSLGSATAMYQVLSYLGFAFPFLMSLASSHHDSSPTRLLVVLLAFAAAATTWLAVVTLPWRRGAA